MALSLSGDGEITGFDPVASGFGKILQVVTTTKTDTFTSTSTSFTDVTGIAATITPTSLSSKILVIVQISVGYPDEGGYAIKVVGGNTGSYIGDSAGSRIRAVFGGFMSGSTTFRLSKGESIIVLDAPNTTSPVEYKVQAIGTASFPKVFINRAGDDSDITSRVRGVSSITLMEIAA